MANVHNVLTATDIHDVTTEKQGVLGQLAHTADGREYRYAKASDKLLAGDTVATATVADKTGTTEYDNEPGAKEIKTSITVADADLGKFEDGVATINKAQYLINGVTKDGRISLLDRLDVKAAKSASVTVKSNKYSVAKSSTGSIGVAEVNVPAGSYFWMRAEESTGAKASS